MRFLKTTFILSLLTFSQTLLAGEFDFNVEQYREAKDSNTYLRFNMESTLFGFLTANFTGYAKKFKIKWDENQESVSNINVVIPVLSMDTNKTSRTREMQESCFESKKYKNIELNINGPIQLKPHTNEYQGSVIIRGKTTPVKIPVSLNRVDDSWVISGQWPVEVTKINILNPTKAKGIATFKDLVDIEYRFKINKS